ncbi:MAG: MlaD family protein [Candidatus Acidiferrales bacterium]
MSMAFRVGVFVFLALLFLSIGVFLIGNKQFLFSPTYRLKAEFQTVSGLNNGAEVRIGGIHQGTVTEIDLPSQPNGKVTVVMNLRSQTRDVVRNDSRASIQTEGILGDKYVDISFGSPNAGPVANDGTIASDTPVDLSEQAHAIANEAQSGVGAFRDDMEALQHNFFLRGFFKRRGYNNPSELTEHAASRLPARAPAKRFDYDTKKIFAKPDNAELNDKGALDDAGKFLKDNPFGVAIVAAAGAQDDTPEGRLVSEARAKVVRDYLAQNFKLDDGRVKTVLLRGTKLTGESSKLVVLVYPPEPAATPAQHPSTSTVSANVGH